MPLSLLISSRLRARQLTRASYWTWFFDGLSAAVYRSFRHFDTFTEFAVRHQSRCRLSSDCWAITLVKYSKTRARKQLRIAETKNTRNVYVFFKRERRALFDVKSANCNHHPNVANLWLKQPGRSSAPESHRLNYWVMRSRANTRTTIIVTLLMAKHELATGYFLLRRWNASWSRVDACLGRIIRKQFRSWTESQCLINRGSWKRRAKLLSDGRFSASTSHTIGPCAFGFVHFLQSVGHKSKGHCVILRRLYWTWIGEMWKTCWNWTMLSLLTPRLKARMILLSRLLSFMLWLAVQCGWAAARTHKHQGG